MDLTDKDKKQLVDINEKLSKDPQDFPIYDGKQVNISRWYDGKETWYNLTLENVSVNIGDYTYGELTNAIAIIFEKRKTIIAYLMGVMVGKNEGVLSYSDFTKQFTTLMTLHDEMPKFTNDDEEYFKMIERIQLKMTENLIDLLSNMDILPDIIKLELIEFAKFLRVDIQQEHEKSTS